MPDKDRLDYKIACMSNDGPPKDHPYLDKVRNEKIVDPVKVGLPVKEEKVDKGFRRILLVGFDKDLIYLLEQAYKGKDVQRFELVFANSTDEAKRCLNSGSKLDYIFTPALKSVSGQKFIVKGKYGRKTEEVPVVDINGYDIAFAASCKGGVVFIYDTSIDEGRARQVGAIAVLSPHGLENEITEHETNCRNAFIVSRKEKCIFLKRFLEKKRLPAEQGSNEMAYTLGQGGYS